MKVLRLAGLLALSSTYLLAGDTKLPELAQIKIAAEQGDSAAQCALGEQYYQHLDRYSAEVWFRKAAVQGLAEAQHQLARILTMQVSHNEDGKSVVRKPNPVEAAEWNVRAANQGHVNAQLALGYSYQNGSGVKQNYVLAYMWYELAARNNNIIGKPSRDAVILKMSSEQVAQGQKLADAFIAQPSSKK